MLSDFKGSKKITSVLNKYFHKPSSECQNAYVAMWEIKVIYFLANSLLCMPLPLSSHRFFLYILPALSVPDWRLSVYKYPYNSTYEFHYHVDTFGLKTLKTWTKRSGLTLPMHFITWYNNKSGLRQFQGCFIQSQQCHKAWAEQKEAFQFIYLTT